MGSETSRSSGFESRTEQLSPELQPGARSPGLTMANRAAAEAIDRRSAVPPASPAEVAHQFISTLTGGAYPAEMTHVEFKERLRRAAKLCTGASLDYITELTAKMDKIPRFANIRFTVHEMRLMPEEAGGADALTRFGIHLKAHLLAKLGPVTLRDSTRDEHGVLGFDAASSRIKVFELPVLQSVLVFLNKILGGDTDSGRAPKPSGGG